MHIKCSLEVLQASFQLPFEVYGELADSTEIIGLTGTSNPNPSSIVYLKNNEYFKELEYFFQSSQLKNNVIFTSKNIWNDSLKTLLADSTKSDFKVFVFDKIELAFCHLTEFWYKKVYENVQSEMDGRKLGNVEVHPTSRIAPNVFIGENVVIEEDVQISPGCFIGANCHIGKNTIFYPNVTLYPFVKVGANCRLHSGGVIGSDGFGYYYEGGIHHKIWHFGGVIIGNHVEIGANSCIDSGTFSPTLVGDGTKIDNQVHIGHNTILGKGVILCGHVGTSGSCKVGDYTVIGGKAGLAPSCSVGAQSQIAGGAMVTKNWPERSILGGHPARNLSEWMKTNALLNRIIAEKTKKPV